MNTNVQKKKWCKSFGILCVIVCEKRECVGKEKRLTGTFRLLRNTNHLRCSKRVETCEPHLPQ